MILAYLVLAHNGERQVARFVDRLLSPESHVFLHWDRKSPLPDFARLLTSQYVHQFHLIRERQSVYWAGFSMVRATLAGLRGIRDSGIKFDRVVLLSGHDYPLKCIEEINEFFTEHADEQFVECRPLPESWRWRVEQYWAMDAMGYIRLHIQHPVFCDHLQYYLDKACCRLLPRRCFFPEFQLYGGSQWWAITGKLACYLVDWCMAHPKVLQYFRFTAVPDEIMLQTIMMQSPFADAVTGDNQHYQRWAEGANHPEILRADDFAILQRSPKLFARKFDGQLDQEILDRLDTIGVSK